MFEKLPNPPTPAELEILQLLWPMAKNEAKRLSEIHREVGEYRAKFQQPAPAVTTVSSALRGALQKGLLREVRVVDGNVHAAPAAGRGGLVATRSPQTAYQANVTPADVLLPTLRQLVELCPEGERMSLLRALLPAFGVAEADVISPQRDGAA